MVFDSDRLSDITVSKSADNKGFYGVATTSLSCNIYTDISPSDGEEITFSGYTGVVFVIAEHIQKSGVVSITAYDRCKNLDVPFDCSPYTQFDENGKAIWYPTSQIVAAAANQCGFDSGGYSGMMSQLCYLDFAEKSCRQILEELSKVDVGHWECAGNSLVFRDFSPPVYGTAIDENDRSEISINGVKLINGIYAVDEIYNTVYNTGAAWKNTERLSGRYLSASIVRQMAGKILTGGGYEYIGWSCDNILGMTLYNIGDCIAYNGKKLPILSMTYKFTSGGMIASLSAPAPDCSFSEYEDVYERAIADRVTMGKGYNGFFIGTAGLGVRVLSQAAAIDAGGERSSSEFMFRTDETGAVTYDKYQIDGEMPVSIDKSSDTERVIHYADADYSLKWDTDENGTKYNIRFERV